MEDIGGTRMTRSDNLSHVTIVELLRPRGVEDSIMRALRPLRSTFSKQDGYESSDPS